jgi:hypothetical protein
VLRHLPENNRGIVAQARRETALRNDLGTGCLAQRPCVGPKFARLNEPDAGNPRRSREAVSAEVAARGSGVDDRESPLVQRLERLGARTGAVSDVCSTKGQSGGVIA